MSHPICVVLDLLGPILYKFYIIRSLQLKRANFSFGLATVLGFLIGCTWEIPFGLLGNQFLITPNNPLGFSIHIIHAVWDSIIFMIGLYALQIRKNARYSTCKKIVYFTLYGLLSEIIAEFIFNGTYWTYNTTNSYNPVLFTLHTVGYTLLPYLVWLIAPPVYLYGIYHIEKHFGKIRIGKKKSPLLQFEDLSSSVFTI
jgi:hypothetical protein